MGKATARLVAFRMRSGIRPEEQQKPPVGLDIRGLFTKVASGYGIAAITYYIGKIRQRRDDERSQKLYAGQQRLLRFLRERQKIRVVFGNVIVHPDGSYHEKGVDLRLALDMYKMAVEDKYDIAFLASSDNDLVPVVEECRNLGKQVVHIGSSLKPSFGLQKACSRSVLLEQKDVLPFVPDSKCHSTYNPVTG